MTVTFLGRASQKRTPFRKACDGEAVPTVFSKNCQLRHRPPNSPALAARPGQITLQTHLLSTHFLTVVTKILSSLIITRNSSGLSLL